jgi:hypothetical protein
LFVAQWPPGAGEDRVKQRRVPSSRSRIRYFSRQSASSGFGELTSKKLQPGTHRSVRELNKDIRDWIGI